MTVHDCLATCPNMTLVITTEVYMSVHVGVIDYAYKSNCNTEYLCNFDSHTSQSVEW